MNDYFSGELGRQRRADYQREVDRDALVSEVRRRKAGASLKTASADAPAGTALGRGGWRVDLGGLVTRRLHVLGNRG